MKAIELNKVDSDVFKKGGHNLANADPKELVRSPEQFKLAIRCCDGSYHIVNSEISDVVRGGIAKNDIKRAVNALAPIDPIHGQRFVIFEENPTGRGYLLGTVEEAIVMLAGA